MGEIFRRAKETNFSFGNDNFAREGKGKLICSLQGKTRRKMVMMNHRYWKREGFKKGERNVIKRGEECAVILVHFEEFMLHVLKSKHESNAV